MIGKFAAGAVAVGITAGVFAGILWEPGGVQAANVPVECAARNAVEHMICGDSQLIGLKKAYDHIVEGSGPGGLGVRSDILLIEKVKLSSLQICSDVECAREWFTDRISDLLSLRKTSTKFLMDRRHAPQGRHWVSDSKRRPCEEPLFRKPAATTR